MQRAITFYWLADVPLPRGGGNFTYSELAWIHDRAFIAQHGEGWEVVSNSVVSFVENTSQALMATTMTRQEPDEVEDTVPEGL